MYLPYAFTDRMNVSTYSRLCFRWKKSLRNVTELKDENKHTHTQITRGVGPALQSSLASWCHVSLLIPSRNL